MFRIVESTGLLEIINIGGTYSLLFVAAFVQCPKWQQSTGSVGHAHSPSMHPVTSAHPSRPVSGLFQSSSSCVAW